MGDLRSEMNFNGRAHKNLTSNIYYYTYFYNLPYIFY